ncbi:MAG: hypothetical protein ACYC96_01790 [Fimbriimonadaceae bacterium]
MDKRLSILASAVLICLSQFGRAQHGQLKLISTDVGHGGTNVYFAGSCLMAFAPDPSNPYGSPFDAYCTVLNVDAYIGSSWGATQLNTNSFVPSPNSGVVAPATWAQTGSEIAWLANTYGVTTNAEQAAATQLSIWDLAEGGNGASTDLFFNSSTGEIKSWSFTDNTIADAQTYASNAIAAFGAGARPVDTWFQADVVLNSNGSYTHVSQDFVRPGATPEPFTLGLSVVGIAVAGYRRRRTR